MSIFTNKAVVETRDSASKDGIPTELSKIPETNDGDPHGDLLTEPLAELLAETLTEFPAGSDGDAELRIGGSPSAEPDRGRQSQEREPCVCLERIV